MSGCTETICNNMRQAQMYAKKGYMDQNLRSDCKCHLDHHDHYNDYDKNEFPVGMAYVPWQKWKCIYEPEQGLKAGTIFKELDLPFCGIRGCRK